MDAGRQAGDDRRHPAGLGVKAFVDRIHYLDGAPPGYVEETRGLVYARLTLAASYELTSRLDLLAQAGGHLTLTNRGDPGVALGAVGVRIKGP